MLLRKVMSNLDDEHFHKGCDNCCRYTIPDELWDWWDAEQQEIKDDEYREQQRMIGIKRAALAKLTKEEQEVLGLLK